MQSLIEHGSSSDSFYFVNNKLIMHNKAKYQYVEAPQQQPAASSSQQPAASEKEELAQP